MLAHASIEHLERVEGCVLTQQCLPQRRFQFSQWIALLLVIMGNSRSLLNLLKLCAIEQPLQQCSLIIKHRRDGCLTALGWQESTRNIQEVRQVDEHGSMC